ncbi:hypothetical protein WN51_13985 [Melipona quadrifasciata]|uniref:Uncharacterized protein n=1 Tax=Melipona quadrifasciata TaxID=166423 RepID=A0A0M8ZZ69_9HYME|nr:hypothetical protein WN51_13985 [Melipona quadrifasciata]
MPHRGEKFTCPRLQLVHVPRSNFHHRTETYSTEDVETETIPVIFVRFSKQLVGIDHVAITVPPGHRTFITIWLVPSDTSAPVPRISQDD